jgi:adenosylcobinamide kinase/adenosylcobinamide-phosphate guanylyltransferase
MGVGLAMKYSGGRFFIATAQAFDDEMKDRIRRHKAERASEFETIESPDTLAESLGTLPPHANIILVDCLTVWLGNMYHLYNSNQVAIMQHIDNLVVAIRSVRCDIILVTNEVGWGIVPENAMARAFRDHAGYLNRQVAAAAQNVYLCVCGIPLKIK